MKINITKYELVRKLIHMFLGTVLTILYLNKVLPNYIYLVILILGLGLSFFIKSGRNVPLISRILGFIDKDDFLPAHGVVFFFTAFVLLILISGLLRLDTIYVVLPIQILTFADPASFFAGRLIGGPKLPFNRHKTYSGTLTGMLVAVVIALIILQNTVAVVIGITAMLMDLINVKIGKAEIDDNLLIPLAAQLTMILLL